jgi:hypothetical protein
MALEKRNGNVYYYRSVRYGKKVRRVYVGAGEIARLAHEQDEQRRAEAEAERAREQDEVERLEALVAPVLEIAEAAEVLERAHLIAVGYRQYQRHWRRERESA